MTSPHNHQIDALVREQQTKCKDLWVQYGFNVQEQQEKLDELSRLLGSVLDQFYMEQFQQVEDRRNDIAQALDDIAAKRLRLGIDAPVTKISGTLQQQYIMCNNWDQELITKVKAREKDICALCTSIRRLSQQLDQTVPIEADIDPSSPNTNLSHTYLQQLSQIEAQLKSHVERNLKLLHESLPFLIYYIKEMNLFEESLVIHHRSDEWNQQGNFIQKFSQLIGDDVYNLLTISQQYQFTTFDELIQKNINIDLIPAAKNIPQQQHTTKTKSSSSISTSSSSSSTSSHIMSSSRLSLIGCTNNSTDSTNDANYIFQHYPLDYTQFPVNDSFIQELQTRVHLFQNMYRERSEFSLDIGDKIRNLWELTDTSQDEIHAWTDTCQDLSMITLRKFQLELIRLCSKKEALLPQWISNHEKMVTSICSKLGIDGQEIERKLSFCRSQLTLDDQLQSLRIELTQMRAELAVRQPILDKIAMFEIACSHVNELKQLENDPHRFKDAKIRSKLDRLRKDSKLLPNKAATLYNELCAFELSHGQLYSSGQHSLTQLQKNEYFQQAKRGGLIIIPRQSDSTDNSSSTTQTATTRTNSTSRLARLGQNQLNQQPQQQLQQPQKSSLPTSTTISKPNNRLIAASKPTMTARRTSRELQKRPTRPQKD